MLGPVGTLSQVYGCFVPAQTVFPQLSAKCAPTQISAAVVEEQVPAFVPVAARVVPQLLVCVNESPAHFVEVAGVQDVTVGVAALHAPKTPPLHVFTPAFVQVPRVAVQASVRELFVFTQIAPAVPAPEQLSVVQYFPSLQSAALLHPAVKQLPALQYFPAPHVFELSFV